MADEDKKIFSQELKDAMLANYRIAMAVDGQEGAFNMLWSKFKEVYLDTKQDLLNEQVAVTIAGTLNTSSLTLDRGFLNITEEFTPTSSADATGVNGDVTHDRDYIYMKTSGTWKRSPIFTAF